MKTYKKTAIIGLCVIVLQAIISLANAGAQQNMLQTLDSHQGLLMSTTKVGAQRVIIDNFPLVDINQNTDTSAQYVTANQVT